MELVAVANDSKFEFFNLLNYVIHMFWVDEEIPLIYFSCKTNCFSELW